MTGAAPIVRIENVVKRFGDAPAVDGVWLELQRGEFFALLGPSGCGKTTLLRLLAGFEQPDEGRLVIDGEDMAGVPPYRRPVNMMFQSYALFPHMSVARNIAFGLKQENLPRREIDERVRRMLALVEMEAFAERRPHQLSGGQRQRVALARALAKEPKLLLLDEPLAALDRKLRERTQLELVELQRRIGVTFLVVTHDQEEALGMASRIAVMERGRLRQLGPPHEIYENPSSRFVADFIGQVNLLEGRVASGVGARLRVDTEWGPIEVMGAGETGAAVAGAVRPEKVRVSPAPLQGVNVLRGTVEAISYHGDFSTYHIAVSGSRRMRAAVANADRAAAAAPRGSEVFLSFPPESGVVLDE